MVFTKVLHTMTNAVSAVYFGKICVAFVGEQYIFQRSCCAGDAVSLEIPIICCSLLIAPESDRLSFFCNDRCIKIFDISWVIR